MEVTTDVLDIESYEKRRLTPASLVRRHGYTWLTRDKPLLLDVADDNHSWGYCQEGDFVRIPMFPYLTKGQDPTVAMGFAFELGFRARDFIDPSYEVTHLHITLGHPVCDYTLSDGSKTIRFWLGFGFVVRKV